MNRLPLPATKSNLLRLKDELSLAREGLEILDEKKTVFISEISRIIDRAEYLRREMEEKLSTAYNYFKEALLTHGKEEIEKTALAIPSQEEIKINERTIMGTIIPLVELKLPPLRLCYGFYGTSFVLDAVVSATHQALKTIAELAEVEVSLYRLLYELKKTLKRINALSNIYIPTYRATIKYIEETIEEKEREDLFRLKRIKKKRGETFL
jgi:V/A-type H+-transporting ATPase subunit D